MGGVGLALGEEGSEWARMFATNKRMDTVGDGWRNIKQSLDQSSSQSMQRQRQQVPVARHWDLPVDLSAASASRAGRAGSSRSGGLLEPPRNKLACAVR